MLHIPLALHKAYLSANASACRCVFKNMNETCSSGESISGPDCCCVLGQEYTYEFSLDGYDLHDDARCEYLWERLAQRRCVPGETVRKPLELDHNDWANLPVDLITKVLHLLRGTDCRFAFQLSQSWATVAREAACFEIRRHVQPSALVSKLNGFRTWRRQHGVPNLSVIFQLTQPLYSLPDVAAFLASITFKEAQFPTNCKVEVVVCNMCMGSQLGREARVIVTEAARLLADHQIGIQLQLAASNSTAPTPQTLQHLAPVLTQLGHYSFPEWQPDPRQQSSETWREYRRRFDIDHLEVMQSGFRHLSMLCIRLYCNTWEALQDMMAALAALHSLKVLHLKIITDKPFVRFRGLDGLQCLEDVALWCHNRADCGSLINVSSQTLRTVKLFAQQWDLNTYEALQSVVKLDSLVIDVYVMTPSEANALKSVSAKYLQLKLHTPGPSVLAALSTAQLHRLVLSHLTDDASAQLGQLQSLESLTIMESLHFSGKELQTQAGVTELVLTSCHGVKRAGLWHIVKTALPALVTVSILPFGHGPGYLLCSHALQAFSFGKHLKSVDLSGVDGITSSMFSEMQQKFHGRQFRGVAQQIVLVHLPAQVPRLPTPEEDSRPTGTVVMSCR